MPANDLNMERIRDWLENREHEDQLRFKVYTSNLMIKFIEKLEAFPDKEDIPAAEKGENITALAPNSELSQSEYILDNFSAQDFTQRTGLPARYRKTIAAFEDIIEERNKACHDTEFEFARLLLTRQFKDPVMAHKWDCEHWSALLLWVSGYATLEDMKKVSNDVKLPPIGLGMRGKLG